MASLTAVVLLAVIAVAHAECGKQFEEPVKASFDLSALVQGVNKALVANDTYYNAISQKRPFKYYFNVCDKLNDPHDEKLCTAAVSADTSAFQIIDATDGKKEECNTLGMTEQKVWELIDAENDNAAVGVKLTYKGGTQCGENKFRSFTINFRCVTGATTLPPISTVSEETTCNYDVTMTSIYGCPLECHDAGHSSLCNNHGVCAVDKSAKRARCFCNKGWSGDVCDTESPESEGDSANSVTSTLIVFAILFLVALLALAYVLYIKIRKLNADDNPYGAFEDQIPNTAALN